MNTESLSSCQANRLKSFLFVNVIFKSTFIKANYRHAILLLYRKALISPNLSFKNKFLLFYQAALIYKNYVLSQLC